MFRQIILLCIAGAVLAGCGGTKPGIQKLPAEESDFVQAKKMYDEGDHVRATELLTAYVEAHPGSNRLDHALLLLGLSHQKTGSNILAVDDLNRLIRDFPQSSFREQAEYERAHSHYFESLGPAFDPESTESALELMKAYLIRYPEGQYRADGLEIVDACLEKLAEKAFLNGQTYLRLKKDEAALLYLEKALATKPDFKRSAESLADLARVCTRLDRDEKAREAWEKLIAFATPERIQRDKKLAGMRREAESALEQLRRDGAGGATP